ncbi:MAG TPA: hypothetical protein VGE62_03375 [Candidatus Paceibacterota bacterium]
MKISKENMLDLMARIVDEIRAGFGEERLVCIMQYGSSLAESERIPNDVDILILADSYHPEDLAVIRRLGKKYPVDLFVDYKDELEQKGIEYYQRGWHGTYFIAIMACARLLYGHNYYKEAASLLPERTMKRDLLYRIEEYFYRLQKEYVQDDAVDFHKAIKLISRICTDLLLFSGDLTFEAHQRIHYLDIIRDEVEKSALFDGELAARVKGILVSNDIGQIPELVGALHKLYLACFDNWKKGDII